MDIHKDLINQIKEFVDLEKVNSEEDELTKVNDSIVRKNEFDK